MQANIQHYKEEINRFLYKKNAFTDFLAKVEEKTEVDRIHIFFGLQNSRTKFIRKLSFYKRWRSLSLLIIVVTGGKISCASLFFLYLIFGYGTALIVKALGVVFPAYFSVKAVENVSKEDTMQWLIYWIVYAVYSVVEYFCDIFLSWFPFYFLMKVGFLLWCMAPTTNNGSACIYRRFIKPFVLKHQAKIDVMVDEAKDRATKAASTVVQKAKHEAISQYSQQQEAKTAEGEKKED